MREQFLEAQLSGNLQRMHNLAGELDEREKELSRRLREDKTYRPLQAIAWEVSLGICLLMVFCSSLCFTTSIWGVMADGEVGVAR